MLAQPVVEAQTYVKEREVKQADQTSLYEGSARKTVWLWVAFIEQVTVFLIRASRGTDLAEDLLGQALGVLVTHRWCAYTWWPLRWRQLCWAHLKRHFQAFAKHAAKPGASEKPFSWRRSSSLSGGIESETGRLRARRYALTRLRCADG